MDNANAATGTSPELQPRAQMGHHGHARPDDHLRDIRLVRLQHRGAADVAAIRRVAGGNGAGDKSVRVGIQFWAVDIRTAVGAVWT